MAGPREKHTLERILQMDWRNTDSTRQQSQLALFNEFLRRTGVWAVALNWGDAHPIVADIPGYIYDGLKAIPVNTVLLQQSLRTLGKTDVFERMLLTRALDWAALYDKGKLDMYNLPDIYEPLLMFYERGGWLEKVRGTDQWNISGVHGTIERAVYYHDLDPIALDNTTLDRLDAARQA